MKVRILLLMLLLVACTSSNSKGPVPEGESIPNNEHPVATPTPIPQQPYIPQSGDAYSLEITQQIEKHSRPGGIIAQPIFERMFGTQVQEYSDAGDGAIWTGNYLAAESFRYYVDHSESAFKNVTSLLNSVQDLLDVTGTNRLARFLLPMDNPYAEEIREWEKHHTQVVKKYKGKDYFWIGNNRRDQYIGVMFGLSVAYDYVKDEAIRNQCKKLVTQLVAQLIKDQWDIVDANNKIVETFRHRFDHVAAFLQLAKHVDPQNYATIYDNYAKSNSSKIPISMQLETREKHQSYFKFNLNHMAMYILMIHEANHGTQIYSDYLAAYRYLREAVKDHANAFFNLVDYSIQGYEEQRDKVTGYSMYSWRERPRWNLFNDLHGKFEECDGKACEPIPVRWRPPEGYLWQDSPYRMDGGGDGRTLLTGIDYILPYWFGRSVGMTFN